jgi:hypothetical protein
MAAETIEDLAEEVEIRVAMLFAEEDEVESVKGEQRRGSDGVCV